MLQGRDRASEERSAGITGWKYADFRGESAHHIAVITKLNTTSEEAAYKIVSLKTTAYSTTCQQGLRPSKISVW